MARLSPFEPVNRRLAVYGYLAPLVAGRRVLEVGCSAGIGVARLRALGATKVVGADDDAAAVARARATERAEGLQGVQWIASLDRRSLEAAGPFDVVIVPDAPALLAGKHGLAPGVLQALLAPRGRLVLVAANGDRAEGAGLGYYALSEALEPHFPRVRMFGLTPFAAYGIAEFEEAAPGLRVDAGLIDDAGEQPSHYVAIGGPDEAVALGYALVQVPFGEGAEAPTVAVAPAPTAAPAALPAEISDLRRRLAEAEGRVDGALRVSRAQTEEIEELRARLRRGAEARAELDQEMGRLRRALAEADESVVSLTRKTTEEMTTLAQRLTAGLRQASAAGEASGDSAPVGRLREDLRRKEAELAARESALSDRDERVAALEAEKQDLLWRLEAAVEDVRRAETRVAERPPVAQARPFLPAANGAGDEELRGLLAQRDQALQHYRQAGGAHVEEVSRLREALAEQSTLVAELEESLAAGSKRFTTAEQELERLRRHAAEVEQADRARRSRLAEVEGTLLRLQRQSPAPPPAPPSPADVAARAEAQRKIGELTALVATLEGRLRDAEKSRSEAERVWGDAVERMVGQPPVAVEPARVDGPKLEAALTEVSRLRDALERSEEQLWETKGQLLLDRERMLVLENQIATMVPAPAPEQQPPVAPVATVTEAAHQAIVGAVLNELGELEAGLRREVARLDAVERTLEDWRADLSVTEAESGVPFSRAE
jgi:SAM-dependent methyltransferase